MRATYALEIARKASYIIAMTGTPIPNSYTDIRNLLEILFHTLAESVSLHNKCHDAIYFEYSYNLVHLLQSKDRIHRLGLPDGQYTQYYFLEEQYVTNDGEPFSLDEKIYDRLREKEQIMLDAIENNVLEKGSTTQEDLDIIFKDIIDDTHSK